MGLQGEPSSPRLATRLKGKSERLLQAPGAAWPMTRAL